MIYHDACGTNSRFLSALCYRIPPAIQEARSRISFGIWVIPAEGQTAGAPWAHNGATCHTVTLESLYFKHLQ